MKIGIVHDYLNQYGGAERVLEVLLEIFPQSTVFTLIYDKNKISPFLSKQNIKKSFLNRFPFSKFYYEYLLPFYPAAVESFDTREFDIIISNSSAWAKGVVTNTKTMHVTYCLNPMRFVWESFFPLIKKKGVISKGLKIILSQIRIWDEVSSKRPDFYITISKTVQKRLKKYYDIESPIIYPPINTEFFVPDQNKRQEEFFLIVSRLKPYKSIELAIESFNRLKKPLVIIGEGTHYNYLKSIAERNIQFLNYVDDKKLLSYYQRCRALIFPQIEDFGIVSLEAQACGKPVIALKKGGALETVVEGKTGLFFEKQSVDSLTDAIKRFEQISFSQKECRDNALKFSKERFKKEFKEKIFEYYETYKREMEL
uniref:Glycosyltransferase family 4 protein n=1 Tax=candidate division WOR-3 bacterium TaxID=2052148 RepID=A0A7C3J713_UNCW3